jgi:putative ABC transport system permease protein
MAGAFQDLKYGARVLRKSPGFSVVAVLVLALGIGANTAIFSVVNAVLLRALPFADPDHIVGVWHVPPPKSFPGMTRFSVSAANFTDWRTQNDVFENIAIYSLKFVDVAGGDKPEHVRAVRVSSGFFAVLGVEPILGRTFMPDEDQLGHHQEAVLSYAFWQSRFGGNRDIVGQQILMDNEPFTVVGVMGPKITYPDWNQKLWVPMAWTPKEAVVRGEHHSLVIARLKPGVKIAQAQQEMSAISERLARQYPEDDKDWGALVVPLREEIVGNVRPMLLVLLGAVAFVLLIACANVANLLLARALARGKEIAIRTALGASRLRLVKQLLCETIILAITGGLAGLGVAHLGVTLIVHFLGEQVPSFMEIGLDRQVLGFTLALSLLTGIVAGLAPAWRLSKANVNETLRQGMGRAGDSGGNRTRAILVVCEVSLALMLLAGAGLMIRSSWNLRTSNPGFEAHNVLTMSLPMPANRYKSVEEEINFWNQLMSRLRSLPGVENAGAVDDLPTEGGSHQPIAIEGRPALALSEQPEVDVRIATTGYLRTMRIPLRRGRDFTESDSATTPAVVLISESMARRFWPNEDVVGKRLTLSFFPGVVREIVGVVGDVKMDGLAQAEPSPSLYMPLGQLKLPPNQDWRSFGLEVVVRTTTPPDTLASAVTNAVHEVSPPQAVLKVMTMDQLLAGSVTQERFSMLLLVTFAALALLLAAMGIYSVLSYAVRRRVREIGIRMALGAQIRDVLQLVMFEGMKPALTGLAIGVVGALLIGRVMASQVFGVTTTDPATFATVSALLAVVALMATVIPAYRATRVDLMKTLRDE